MASAVTICLTIAEADERSLSMPAPLGLVRQPSQLGVRSQDDTIWLVRRTVRALGLPWRAVVRQSIEFTEERGNMNEAFWMLTTVIFGIGTGCFAQAWLAARAEVRRLQGPGGPTGSTAALHRIEHAVDAIALEVERVAEHQRFVARLAQTSGDAPSEGSGAPMPSPRHLGDGRPPRAAS